MYIYALIKFILHKSFPFPALYVTLSHNQNLNDMKKILILILFAFITSFAHSQGWELINSSKKGDISIRLVSPKSNNMRVGAVDDPVWFTFSGKRENSLQVFIFNATENKIVVKWNDAKLRGDKVVFGSSRFFSVDKSLDDESIYPGKMNNSSSWDIIPKGAVERGGTYPLYYSKDIIKKEGKMLMSLDIPIEVNGKEVLYEFTFEIKYFPK